MKCLQYRPVQVQKDELTPPILNLDAATKSEVVVRLLACGREIVTSKPLLRRYNYYIGTGNWHRLTQVRLYHFLPTCLRQFP
jgi:hypothetical protein